jgi:glycosyltransferase involved in cell wall biosynthesis
MKICHLTSVHPATDIRIFHKECVSLAKAGHEVKLVALNAEPCIVEGVTIIGPNMPPSNRMKRFFTGSRLVCKEALKTGADVYHFHDPELMFRVLRLKKKGKKVIYDVHEDLPRQIATKHWIPGFLKGIVSRLVEYAEDNCARKFDAIVTATPHLRQRFGKYNTRTVAVCNFPEPADFPEQTNREENSSAICYAGGLFRSRGITELMMAAHLAGVPLHLAGRFSPGTYQAELMHLPAWENVTFHGFLDREGISSLLRESTMGALTLLPHESYRNSFPIKLFEYMAAGVPVIASDFPLWKEIIEGNHCGICVDPLDIPAIAEAITTLASDRRLATEMGRNGRKAVVEKYNWKSQEAVLLGLYESLSQPPSP